MTKNRRTTKPARTRPWLVVVLLLIMFVIVGCVVLFALLNRDSSETTSRQVILSVAYTPEKQEVFEHLVSLFNETDPRLPSGKRVSVSATRLTPEEMIEAAEESYFQVLSPDSSLWLSEIDRRWQEENGTETSLVGERTRYMVSPVVIAMWDDTAKALGYPDKELGWADLLRAASEDPGFKWSHPSANTASGLLATLAEFYAAAGVTRGLTEELATAETTLAKVSELERTVKQYGEGEMAVIEQIESQGRDFLDAFVVQEQLVVQYNQRHGKQLVAIYPFEGTLWEDHPLALLERPGLTDEERLAYALFRDFLLSSESQQEILAAGYRPTDLTIQIDQAGSPISQENGADPSKPATTLQIPSYSVVSVIKNVWWYTKRHTNIYLVVDVSGSMEGRNLEEAQTALHAFLTQIEGDLERVGLIIFANDAYEVVPLGELVDTRPKLDYAIDALTAGGNTALLDAVNTAAIKLIDLNDSERINAIVAMTDGKENQSRIGIRELTRNLETAAEGTTPVIVFCIGYGRSADFELLNEISAASGGFTRQGELETIQDLYETLSTYF